MPKSYMIRRLRKKRSSSTNIVKNCNIRQGFKSDTTKSECTISINPLPQDGSVSHFKFQVKSTDHSLASIPKVQEDSIGEVRQTDTMWHTKSMLEESEVERFKTRRTIHYRNQVTPYGLLPSPVDYLNFNIPSHFLDLRPRVEQSKVNLATNDNFMYCGIPDNISPKSATSVKERSPTFPTNASVPTQWSPHTIKLPFDGEEIFNFDPKSLPKSTSIISPKEVNKFYKYDEPIDMNASVYGSKSTYIHSDMNAGIEEMNPTLTFSPRKSLIQMNHEYSIPFCTIPLSHQTVEINAPNTPKSIPSKRIELVNDGFGITNPVLAPLVINEDTKKAKQPHQISACQVCGLIFQKQKLLTKHIKTHHDKIKMFLCTICTKGFNDKYDLKRHTRTHTGVKPFKCEDCDKGFSQRCSLESHCKKVHSHKVEFEPKQRRDKIHICEECGSTTKDPNAHYVHIKKNHPDSELLSKFHDKRQFKSTVARIEASDSLD